MGICGKGIDDRNRKNRNVHDNKESSMTENKKEIKLLKEENNSSFKKIYSISSINSKNEIEKNISNLKGTKSILNTTRATNILDIEENATFPPGEQRYILIKDSNKSKLIGKNDNLSKRVELFFSLNNVKNPNNLYSFHISIINNKKVGNSTYLGILKDGKGENIEFGNFFEVDYFFEREQTIIIEPQINGKQTVQKKSFILSSLMTSRESRISINFEEIGTMEISQKSKNQDNELNTEISCFQFLITLTNHIFLKSNAMKDIFYVIKNIKDGKKKRPIYKSYEYNFELNKEKNTAFISIDSDMLCNDNNSDIFFELYSLSINPKTCIGFCKFTLNKLKSNLEKDEIEKIEIESQEYGPLGNVKINYYSKEKISFEKFIKKGQINLEIAIDYTQSNGLPQNKSSLHYKYGKEPNDYEKAIRSCGDIIAYYDSDQLFPVYGFGGIPEGQKEVNHCFNINFNDDDPNISEVDNIIKFYKESLDKIKLYGPSYYSPVINKVIAEINNDLEKRPKENNYYILMILTDGIITDMIETIDCIVEGSKLPLSIVIIGIGDANFENMDILDGDKIPLINSYGEIRKRDIVQFVEFNKYKDENGINNGDDLAEEVLKEIPRQIEEYYHFCGKFYE